MKAQRAFSLREAFRRGNMLFGGVGRGVFSSQGLKLEIKGCFIGILTGYIGKTEKKTESAMLFYR